MVSIFDKNDNLKYEWSDKNGDLNPTKISYGSSKKVWWICDKGHEWEAAVKNRTKENPSGCPYCGHRKVLSGFNDLEILYPKIAKEWSKRNVLKADEVMAKSNRKAWWICSLGHEYEMDIPTRTDKGAGCPYCSGVLLTGFNDLQTTHPDLAKEYLEYNRLPVKRIKSNSTENVRWKCSTCNHEWMMVVKTRVKGSGCPECERKRRLECSIISDQKRRAKRKFLQQKESNIIKYYIKRAGIEFIENDTSQIGINLSIYLPQSQCAIELSRPVHVTETGKKRELSKDSLCKKNGIRLIRVLDPGYEGHDECLSIRKHDNSNEAIEQTVSTLFNIMGYGMDIDVERDFERMLEIEMQT